MIFLFCNDLLPNMVMSRDACNLFLQIRGRHQIAY